MDGIIGTRGSLQVLGLEREGLLGPDCTLIHCAAIADEAWDAVARSGALVTLATTSEQQIVGLGDGQPPIVKLLARDIRPSLSCDVEASVSGDLFSQMRATLGLQHMDVTRLRHLGQPAPRPLRQRDALDFATAQGARAVGLEDRVGTLTPGKAADIVVIRGEDINNTPINDPVATVVQGTDSSNIDTVLVGGMVRKWRGQLVGPDISRLRASVRQSRDRLAREVSGTPSPAAEWIAKAPGS
jgi:cytosine/adenosine deaminase-related metal-dependent hydrolase